MTAQRKRGKEPTSPKLLYIDRRAERVTVYRNVRIHECAKCGAAFEAHRSSAAFCSMLCRVRANRLLHATHNARNDVRHTKPAPKRGGKGKYR